MSISIIIPVYNEQENIQTALAKLCDYKDKDIQIIVVDNHPDQNTLPYINDPKIITKTSAPGRGKAFIEGVNHAFNDVLLFLHSDTILPPKAINTITDIMADPNIAGGAFDLKINSSSPVFRVIEKIASIRSRLTRIPYGDQAIFVRRSVYQDLGGFQDFPIMEELDFMRRLKQTGHRIKISHSKANTSPRRWQKEGVLFTTLRNWSLVILWNLGVSPKKLIKLYKPNKK